MVLLYIVVMVLSRDFVGFVVNFTTFSLVRGFVDLKKIPAYGIIYINKKERW